VLRLRRAIADADVGVVHSHSPVLAVAARVLIRTLPRRHRPVHVCTIHSLWGSKHPLTRAADRATARLDDASFAVSRAVASSLPAALRRRCEVLHHGVDVDAVVAAADGHRAAVRAELGIGDDELVVVTAANLRKQKGYPDLLAAAALVVAERPDVRFVTFGQGQQAEEVAAQHRASGQGDRFLLLGYRDDPARIVGAADVACLASVAEGFPLALVEAAVLGLPVVATEVGGIPEVVQRDETGVLVPPGRPDLLAEALLALLGDPDRRAALGRAAAERGQAMSIGAAVARYERCYEELVPSLGTTA
jgi:glycosyltransferase involved in cell wall biosynthesis